MNLELRFKVLEEKMLRKAVFSLTQTPKDRLFRKLVPRKSKSFSHTLGRQAMSAGTSISVFSYFYLITHSLID